MRNWSQYVRDHLSGLRVSPERDNEIVNELALQLEQAYEEALSSGLAESEAAVRAESHLGDWCRLAAEIGAAERPAPLPVEPAAKGSLFSGALHDLRQGIRFLRCSPLIATLGIATLAFGIGANTAIFTFVDAIALRPLPYDHPHRLMAIECRRKKQADTEPWISALDFWDFRDRAGAFEKIAAVSPIWNVVLTGRGEAQNLQSLFVSAEFFPLLAVRPLQGRLFVPSDDQRTHGANVVILSYAFWQRMFGGSADAVGASMALDGAVYTVAGVLPADFRYLGEPLAGVAVDIDVWLPLADNQIIGTPRGVRYLKVIGRLKSGVTAVQANDETARLGHAFGREYPDTNSGFTWTAFPLGEQITGRSRTIVLLLLGAVGFVLMMACGNVAHLLLARAATRERDLAIRVAMGASRYRLLRHMLCEGAVLTAVGAIAGVLLAWILVRLLVAVAPESLVHAHDISLDLRALIFTATASILSALLAGLPPAWRMARSETADALRQGGRSITAGNHRLRAALVVMQVGLALALLMGAGLVIRSFVRLLEVNPGFNAQHLFTVSIQTPISMQEQVEQRVALYNAIRARLLALPDVKDVAAVSRLPLLGSDLGAWLYREGVSDPGGQPPDIQFRVATVNYFSSMGIPLRRGRMFDERDLATLNDANLVALIDEAAAEKFWPGEDPVGKRIKMGPNVSQPWTTIVGVVGNVHHSGLAVAPPPHAYRPYLQSPLFAPILVIRTVGDPALTINAATVAIHSVDRDIPVYSAFTMESLVARSAAQKRFLMWLLSGFAVAAMLLAMVGIYGTVAQSVVQRTPEIGLRIALGAPPSAALRLILLEGLQLTATGILLGGLASLSLTRLMRSVLFEVHPLDPVAFLTAAGTLGAFSLLSSYLPARRATRVDPLTALRVEG